MCVLFDEKIRTSISKFVYKHYMDEKRFPAVGNGGFLPHNERGKEMARQRGRDRGGDVEGAGEIEKETERGIEIEGDR